jgi:hypothetical protein
MWLKWLNAHGITKTPEEVAEWSQSMDNVRPYNDQEKRDWFAGECEKLDLDPAKTTLFRIPGRR